VTSPEPVPDTSSFIQRVVMESRGGGVLIGVDFPIGVPRMYARRAEISHFPTALREFGTGRWDSFYNPATVAAEISLQRPFYPAAPGGRKQSHLTAALGVERMADLLRECERRQTARNAGCSLFWTLGGNQVGRAAISGWRDMLAPALTALDIDLAMWPFDGELKDLIESHSCVVVETYPAEACVQLGLGAPGRGWSKRRQGDRRTKCSQVLASLHDRHVEIADDLRSAFADGFGPKADGEDRFDAVIGLLAMLDVLAGRRSAGAPPDDAIRAVDGWIFGQSRIQV